MTQSFSKPSPIRSVARAVLAGLVAVVIVVGCAGNGARAAGDDDDEEAFDTKFFKGVLRSFGLRNGTEAGPEYRERSPLVVPPSRNLPTPETGTVAEKVKAWPTDQDVKRSRQAKAAKKQPWKSAEDEGTPLSPDVMRRGAASKPDHQPTGDSKDFSAPSTKAELGAKSMFTWGSLFGQKSEEYGTFASEPPRATLLQPPAGYRTPSPNQPYGVGKEKWTPEAVNPMDTPGLRGTER